MKYREKYLECGGVFCPYCGSHHIEGNLPEIDEGGVTQNVTCTVCLEEWQDTYTLTNVEPIPEPKQWPHQTTPIAPKQ